MITIITRLTTNAKQRINVWSQALFLCLVVSLVVAVMWLWGFNTHSFNRRDAFDYAQLTRQVYRGEGLSTLQIFPRHIPYFHAKGILESSHWPNLYRNPLVAITGTAFQWFFQSTTVAMVIQSGFWHLASVALLFWLAKEITNLEVAVLSTLFFASDPVVLLYSYGGMTESLATFLLLLFFIIIISERLKAWRWLLLGAISILAYLARTQLILLAPLALVFAWTKAPKGMRISAILLILAGVSLPLIPWSIRNLQMAGDPLFSFTTTRNLVLDAVPGHSDLEMQLHAPADLFSVADLYGSAILTKSLSNVSANIFSPLYWANSFRRTPIFLPLFAFVSLLRLSSASGEKYRFLVWSTLALILATFLLISLTVYSVRSYVMFRPLIIMIGINEIIFLIRRTFASRTIHIGISTLLLLLAGYMLVTATIDHKVIPAPLSQFDQKAYEILNRRTEEGALIASDISEQVSLFTGRRTLRLPAEPAELLEIDMEYIQVDYVLLSRDLMIGSYAEDNDPGYHETYQNYEDFSTRPEFLEIYSLDERLPNGSLLFRRNQQQNSK